MGRSRQRPVAGLGQAKMKARSEERNARLAKALRENLKRRKARARSETKAADARTGKAAEGATTGPNTAVKTR